MRINFVEDQIAQTTIINKLTYKLGSLLWREGG